MIALPGAGGLFFQIQESLQCVNCKKVMLTRGVHNSLADFLWLAEELSYHPVRILELVPLTQTLTGNHYAYGYICGGVWIPVLTSIPRVPQQYPSASLQSTDPNAAHPTVWRAHFLEDVVSNMVSFDNPKDSVTNSSLELAGSIPHNKCATQCFGVIDPTILTHTNNAHTLWWQRKGSTTSSSTLFQLLCSQAFHQHFHCYIPRQDFIAGVDDITADNPSWSETLIYMELVCDFNCIFYQKLPWRLWTPYPTIFLVLAYLL